MAGTQEQGAWVLQVLGVSTAKPSGGRGAAPEARMGLVKAQKLRLIWLETRRNLGAELERLKQTILEETRDTEIFAEVQSGVAVLDGILEELDERLIDKLDEIYVCAQPVERHKLVNEAKGIIAEYATFVAGDPLMRAIDSNPFTPVAVASQARTTLKALSAALV